MKAGIYDPYLDTLGGGERYCLSVVECLLKNGWEVDLFWSGDQTLIDKAEKRFCLDLKKVQIVPDIFNVYPKYIDNIDHNSYLSKVPKITQGPIKIKAKVDDLREKYSITRKYDMFFFISDGSVPVLFSKKNILHIQVPFTTKTIKPQFLLTNLKSKLLKNIVCNSKFTSRFAYKFFKHPVDILYPPVDTEKFDSTQKKKNIILSVGRFDNILNSKKQDILVDAFVKMVRDTGLKDWKLVFVGGSLQKPEQSEYIKLLKEKAKGFPIEFYFNTDFETLKKFYAESKIYWHAAGYNVNENETPQFTEHFGISLVEAMASGSIPVGINKGGIPEIVTPNVNGFLWDNVEELIGITQSLIDNPKVIEQLKINGIKQSKIYSKENFETELLKIINR